MCVIQECHRVAGQRSWELSWARPTRHERPILNGAATWNSPLTMNHELNETVDLTLRDIHQPPSSLVAPSARVPSATRVHHTISKDRTTGDSASRRNALGVFWHCRQRKRFRSLPASQVSLTTRFPPGKTPPEENLRRTPMDSTGIEPRTETDKDANEYSDAASIKSNEDAQFSEVRRALPRPHKCSHCVKILRRARDLDRHLHTHTRFQGTHEPPKSTGSSPPKEVSLKVRTTTVKSSFIGAYSKRVTFHSLVRHKPRMSLKAHH